MPGTVFQIKVMDQRGDFRLPNNKVPYQYIDLRRPH